MAEFEKVEKMHIYIDKMAVCVFVWNIFLHNHLLMCYNYLSLSSNFYHQGKTTNLITYFCVMITQVLVQTFNTKGKYQVRYRA